VDSRHFAAVADDWDIEARAVETLARVGVLPGAEDVLDRPVSTLSGGEAKLSGVAGLLLRPVDIWLLDEPTNNLDARGRELLYGVIDTWPGALIVVSHDRELLERVDQIVELRDARPAASADRTPRTPKPSPPNRRPRSASSAPRGASWRVRSDSMPRRRSGWPGEPIAAGVPQRTCSPYRINATNCSTPNTT
jgi:energy-coupling factor transporter ATP-binding protein EcfA2